MKISDLYWPVTFFSTAFGAGIFFLPQSVGPTVLGMTPFLVFITVAMLISLMAHYLFFKYISFHPEKDFLAASSDFIGRRYASIICLLFIVSMMIIVMINFIALVNVVSSFFNDNVFIRFIVSLLLSSALSMVWLIFNTDIERMISRIALLSIISVIVVVVFFLFQPVKSQLFHIPGDIRFENITLLPVFLFTFNFTPCIQRFTKSSGTPGAKQLIAGKVIIFIFILIFVIAVSRLLIPEDINTMNTRNIDSLSYTANLTDKPLVWFGAALILFLLTAGAYTGTLTGVIDGIGSFGTFNKRMILSCNIFICTMIGTANPSIVKIIANGSIPVIVITVFFIPSVYFIMKGRVLLKIIGSLVLLSGTAVIATLFI
ncbi:threonine/serine transporter [Pectobacterium brasiliense]|uniref:threonine/serine transporter n=1 Tax=Pectobacterium brasiliense TaxID=180957 RepID=UPI001968DB7A|nr:threonine/serine transporter [Pectobacterium brasiliense]MBN3265103.1 threonine/serine transporter [Pectobacterium brasiliense]